MFDKHNHYYGSLDHKKIELLIENLKEYIMATQDELAAALNAATEKVTKIEGETQSLIDKVAALMEAVKNAGNTTPEVDTALAALQAKLDEVDKKVDDVVVV